MSHLAMSFMDLSDISEVEPITDGDKTCLEALREVLKQHGKLDRFGITLLHSHFPVYEGEILLETCDPEARTLSIRPVKDSDAELVQSIPTTWRLTDGEEMLRCERTCVDRGDKHRVEHVFRHEQETIQN